MAGTIKPDAGLGVTLSRCSRWPRCCRRRRWRGRSGRCRRSRALPGCISETGTGGACQDGTALNGAFDLAASADGEPLRLVERSDAVAIFDRDGVTGGWLRSRLRPVACRRTARRGVPPRDRAQWRSQTRGEPGRYERLRRHRSVERGGRVRPRLRNGGADVEAGHRRLHRQEHRPQEQRHPREGRAQRHPRRDRCPRRRLTGADVLESTLTTVPSASTAKSADDADTATHAAHADVATNIVAPRLPRDRRAQRAGIQPGLHGRHREPGLPIGRLLTRTARMSST